MRQLSFLAAAVAAATLLSASPIRAEDDAEAQAEEKLDLHPTEGPAKVNVGTIAELQLPESAVFFGKDDTRKLLERMGNITDGTELGLVWPKAEGEDWFIVFEYDDTGYIKDAAKEKIDADDLLESIQKGTERANEERKRRGHHALHVTGWAEPPHYDARTQNLTWATLNETDDGQKGMNYNVRLLGRRGVMRVTLVDAPEKLAASKPAAEKIIAAFGFRQGSRYSEWREGDKVAAYGLTALVAGGAGAAAAKFGLFAILGKFFAKMGKAIVLVIAAVGAAIAKAWKSFVGLFRRRKAGDMRGPPPAPPPGPSQGGGFLE